MKFNKKGLVLMYGLMFGLAGGLIAYFIISQTSGREFSSIGQEAIYLIKTSKETEQALFYIDQSAKYSAYQTIYELGQKGGYKEPSCGSYLGYSLWSTETKKIDECLPNYKENFKSIFNTNLNAYVIKYPDAEIPKDNYDFSLKTEDNKLEIIGKAKEKLVFEIKKEKNR